MRAESDRRFDEFKRGGGGLASHTEIVTNYMIEWESSNPAPVQYYNKITGETWGKRNDPRPAPDWSARANGKP